MNVTLDLPYPPSANRLWRTYRGRVCKSREYKDWLVVAGFAARSQGLTEVVGPYKISINATRPDKRRRDLDNIIKPVSDLMQSIGVIKNDSDCELLTARWLTTGDGVNVRIEPAGTE